MMKTASYSVKFTYLYVTFKTKVTTAEGWDESILDNCVML